MSAGVAIADVPPRSQIEVAGKDAERFLHNLCTNDIKKLKVGAGCEALFLDARGKIVESAIVFRLSDSKFWLDSEPGRATDFIKHLDRFLIREDVKLTDQTASHATIRLVGVQSRPTLQQLLDGELPGPGLCVAESSLEATSIQVRVLDLYQSEVIDVVVPVELSNALHSKLARNASVLSASEFETLRIVSGVPAFSIDYGNDNLPQELDRNSRMISFTKGCYIGQETVARLDSFGHVNRVLRGVMCSAPISVGASIYQDGKEVGKLTSSAAQGGRHYGLAIVRSSASKPQTTVQLRNENSLEQDATIVPLPFVSLTST